MADSVRQKIVDAVVARMQLIDGTGDYVTNVQNVEDSRLQWQEEDLPAISVFDGDALATPTSPNPMSVIRVMPILIRGFLQSDEATAANIRNLMKDIERAIRVDDRWTVNNVPLVMQTRQIRDAITRNPDSFEVEAGEVEIEVQFKTQKFNTES
jgi:hypothetical protein